MNDRPKQLSYLERLTRDFNTVEQSKAKREARSKREANKSETEGDD